MKYRKKPVVINAVQWTGQNADELARFLGGGLTFRGEDLIIKTLEGDMKARQGDYIICGVNGEFYPCDEGIFEKTYEPV